MDIIPNEIDGCYEIHPRLLIDERGSFVKTFNDTLFESQGLATNFKESYYSRSNRGVLRGMHFQTPPHDHVKMVYCTEGEVIDVVIDLRPDSPTYGKHQTFIVSADKANMIYIPEGMAHGFYVLSEYATMVYNVTSTYSPESDSGIHWASAGIDWPNLKPVISKRDDGLVSLDNFDKRTFIKAVKS